MARGNAHGQTPSRFLLQSCRVVDAQEAHPHRRDLRLAREFSTLSLIAGYYVVHNY